jgi:hypothetical protein
MAYRSSAFRRLPSFQLLSWSPSSILIPILLVLCVVAYLWSMGVKDWREFNRERQKEARENAMIQLLKEIRDQLRSTAKQ